MFIVPRHRLAVSARYLATHYGRIRCWAFPDPEREVFDQIVLMGYRKADPTPDAPAEEQVREWAEGEPEEMYPHRYPHRYGPVDSFVALGGVGTEPEGGEGCTSSGVYDPSTGHVVSRTDPSLLIPYNYLVLGVARYEGG